MQQGVSASSGFLVDDGTGRCVTGVELGGRRGQSHFDDETIPRGGWHREQPSQNLPLYRESNE